MFFSNQSQTISRWFAAPKRLQTLLALQALLALHMMLAACSLLPAGEPAVAQESIEKQESSNAASLLLFPVPEATPTITLSLSPTLQTPTWVEKSQHTLDAIPASTAEAGGAGERAQPPTHSSDLVFLADSNLLRWDHVTNYTSVLAQDVVDYSVSSNGKKLALLRPRNMVANGIELFDLAMLDMDSKQLVTLLPAISKLMAVISPDGKWIAYTNQVDDPGIYMLPAAGQSQPISVGECRASGPLHCTQLVWSADSRTILWDDSLGVWIAGVDKTLPELIHPHHLQVSDPKGNQTRLEVSLSQFSWSPQGRFVLVHIAPNDSNVSWYGLLDTRKGMVVEVPDSFQTDTPLASIDWAINGDLFVVNSGLSFTNQPATIKIWQVVPTRSDLLLLKKTYNLAWEHLVGNQAANSNSRYLTWLSQRSPDTLAFALQQPETGANPILYEFDFEEDSLRLVRSLPSNISELFWSPDGSGILILGSQNQVMYAPVDGSTPYDLLPVLGMDAHSFLWLPPNPRQ